uniref:Uncharacterized protein n=1 Tax=Arundo donax TaxID=35708 RepID=A0A0A9AAQ9_ARUDO
MKTDVIGYLVAVKNCRNTFLMVIPSKCASLGYLNQVVLD